KNAGTPRLVLHDIDANKPAGSIAIRVKTFGHTLSLRQDELNDLATKKAELARRIEDRLRAMRGEAPLPPRAQPPVAPVLHVAPEAGARAHAHAHGAHASHARPFTPRRLEVLRAHSHG